MLLIVLATICYAFSVNLIKSRLKSVNSIAITSLSFLSIGPFTIIYLFTTDFLQITQTNENSLLALFFISVLAIFGTALAVILFNMLIKKFYTTNPSIQNINVQICIQLIGYWLNFYFYFNIIGIFESNFNCKFFLV